MHLLLEQHGYVVALHSSALARRARSAAAHRPLPPGKRPDRPVPVDLPPLGLAVLARQLRQLSVCDLSPGVLASAARLLTHYLHAGALLGSVAKLDRVPVSLKSHAKSWMPGSQFGVLAHPQPQLVRIAPGATLTGPEFSTSMLIGRGQLQSDWVSATLATSWSVQGAA